MNCDLVIWSQSSGPLCLWQCLYFINSPPNQVYDKTSKNAAHHLYSTSKIAFDQFSKLCHWRHVSPCTHTWNLSNVLHVQNAHFFLQFYLRKARWSRYFWQQIENGEWYTHLFWTNCQFLLLYYKLTSASYTEKVILCVNSWKSYRSPSPKVFCTIAIHDKFHVCAYPELSLHETHSLPYLLPEQAI